MAISSVFNNALQGYNLANQHIEKVSAEINRATTEQPDAVDSQLIQQRQLLAASPNEAGTPPVSQSTPINESLVNLKVAEFSAKANINTMQTADDMLSTLIDIKV